MADTAAHLVDHVFPVVPVRQWVLSSPFALRYKMAYDARLMSDVLNIFARAVLGHLRRRARKFLGLRDSQSGAVTSIQRFGDALNCKRSFPPAGYRRRIYAQREPESGISRIACA